jgi:DNA-directed RNA polymerase subunit omega
VEKLDFIDSKFRLAILAAKRGKQLVAGAKKKVDTNAENPLTVAIEEIYKEKIKIKILKEDTNSIDDEDNSSLILGNDDEVVEYENDLEDMLYKDDDDSDDQDKDY